MGLVSPWKSLPLCLSYRTLIGHPSIPGIRLLTPSISLTALPISIQIQLGWSGVLSWPYSFTHLQHVAVQAPGAPALGKAANPVSFLAGRDLDRLLSGQI